MLKTEYDLLVTLALAVLNCNCERLPQWQKDDVRRALNRLEDQVRAADDHS